MRGLHLAFTLCTLTPFLSHAQPLNHTCKLLPGDAAWPTESAWRALNASVSGRLLATVPAGAVCHAAWPQQYDNASCAALAAQWTNTSFHADDPVSSDYNDDTCPPSPLAPCSAAGYPAYTVQAADAADVRAAVDFARHTGIRLVVKGTGHDYPGRSAGAGSLSIHTRGMRGLVLDRNDSRATALGGIASVKIAAGEVFASIHQFASTHNVTVVGGADPGVGIGGWITAGGHGPLTSKYGFGADQVIEMEVVTADGVLRTVDEKTDGDLFWALRGGGGSTFAVMTSATVKVYPAVPVAEHQFRYNTTANSPTFWALTTYFHTQLPALSDAGLMGYYYSVPDIGATLEPNASMRGKVAGVWLAPDKSSAELAAILAPMEAAIASGSFLRNGSDNNNTNTTSSPDPAYVAGYGFDHPDFSFWKADNDSEAVGHDGRLGSRLLDRRALTANATQLNRALRASSPDLNIIIGHVVAGKGVRAPPGGIPGGGNAILPAWRDAYVHAVLPATWPTLDAAAKQSATTALRDTRTAALRALAPDTGAYRNEADPTEPDWQRTFYGASAYPRLLAAKRRWDPHGVFWCKSCVGSELWTARGADGGNGVEVGVGQGWVRLCWAS